MVYGRPDGSYRTEYDDVMWNFFNKRHGWNRPIHTTLKETIKEALNKIEEL